MQKDRMTKKKLLQEVRDIGIEPDALDHALTDVAEAMHSRDDEPPGSIKWYERFKKACEVLENMDRSTARAKSFHNNGGKED